MDLNKVKIDLVMNQLLFGGAAADLLKYLAWSGRALQYKPEAKIDF